MPIQQTYYLNAPGLASATTVYLDIAQSFIAPDGFYSDGIIVREQISGVLQPAQPCPNCGVPCVGKAVPIFNWGGNAGEYLLPINLGPTTGAVIIEFLPKASTDGIKAEYNSVTYGPLSSQNFGLIQSAGGLPVFFGDTSVCDPEGAWGLQEYVWDGSTFNLTPNAVGLNVTSSQIVDTGGDPGYSIMVIPKTTINPQGINVNIYSPCPPAEFDFSVRCPQLLPSFLTTTPISDVNLICSQVTNETYYVAHVNGSGDQLGYYDWVFSDPYGQNILPNGWYNAPIHLQSLGQTHFRVLDGIIIEMGNTLCPTTDLTVKSKSLYSGCTAGGLSSGTIDVDWEPIPQNVYTDIFGSNATIPVLMGLYTVRVSLTFGPASSSCPNVQIVSTLTDNSMGYSDTQTYAVPNGGGVVNYSWQFPIVQTSGPYILEVNLFPA